MANTLRSYIISLEIWTLHYKTKTSELLSCYKCLTICTNGIFFANTNKLMHFSEEKLTVRTIYQWNPILAVRISQKHTNFSFKKSRKHYSFRNIRKFSSVFNESFRHRWRKPNCYGKHSQSIDDSTGLIILLARTIEVYLQILFKIYDSNVGLAIIIESAIIQNGI